MSIEAEILRAGLVDCQVCVPIEWTDEQVVEFTNTMNPTGITSQWAIRRAGNHYLNGAPKRVTCAEDPTKVHIMLDC